MFDYVPVETNFKVTTPTDGSNDAHWDGDSDNTTSDPSLNVDFDGNINTDFAGRDSFGLEYNSDHPLFGSYFTTSEKLAVRPTGDVVTVGSTVRRLEGELLTATTGTGGPRFLSDTTIAQFDDIGYVTVLNAIPEPSSLMLFSLTSIGLLVRRRRR